MAFTLSSIGDSYTAFSYNGGEEHAVVNTMWGDLKLYGIAEGFGGDIFGTPFAGSGDNRKGHVPTGVFTDEIIKKLPAAYPFSKLIEAAVGGKTAEEWSTTIPGPYITNPSSGVWAGYAPALYGARNNKPVVFFTLGGNDIFFQIREATGHLINDNTYFDGTLMPAVEQYFKNIVDYIMWLTGGDPSTGLPGSAEIVLASYVNFSVQDYDGSTVEKFFYTNNDHLGNWNNAIWCAEHIGAYADFYNYGNGFPAWNPIYPNYHPTADDAMHLIADQLYIDKWGTPVNRSYAWTIEYDWDWHPSYGHPYYYGKLGYAPWEVMASKKPTNLLDGQPWLQATGIGIMNGWGLAARNVTDVKINTLFRKLDPVYQNIESWAETKYRKNAVIYCPVWKAVANPLKPNTPVEYRSWPRDHFNDSIHLTQAGWRVWLNAIFEQWFPRSTYIPQLNTVSTFSGFMY